MRHFFYCGNRIADVRFARVIRKTLSKPDWEGVKTVMATKKKKATVKELGHLFANSSVLIFTDYRGLKVSDLTNLRRVLRDKGVEYHITKNTLAELAAHRASMDGMLPMLDGPTAIAFVGDDIPGAAKILTDFVRTSKILQIRGGLMGNKTISADEIGDLTKILTKEQYLSQLMGAMRAPIQNFVNVLNAPIQSFVNVLSARLDQMKEGGASVPEVVSEAASEPVAEVASEVASEPVSEVASEPVSEVVAEPVAEVATEAAAPEAETVPETEAAPEVEAAAAPDAEAETAVETAPDAETAGEEA
jgi:large subunit ribosomal protein L10